MSSARMRGSHAWIVWSAYYGDQKMKASKPRIMTYVHGGARADAALVFPTGDCCCVAFRAAIRASLSAPNSSAAVVAFVV